MLVNATYAAFLLILTPAVFGFIVIIAAFGLVIGAATNHIADGPALERYSYGDRADMLFVCTSNSNSSN